MTSIHVHPRDLRYEVHSQGAMANRSVHVICTYLPTGTLGEATGKSEIKVRKEAFDNMVSKLLRERGESATFEYEQPTEEKVAELRRKHIKTIRRLS